MVAGTLLALSLFLAVLAFLVAVAKKYSRSALKDPVDEAGAAAIAMAMPVGIIVASAAHNELLFVVLGLVLFSVEAIWFTLAYGEGSAERTRLS